MTKPSPMSSADADRLLRGDSVPELDDVAGLLESLSASGRIAIDRRLVDAIASRAAAAAQSPQPVGVGATVRPQRALLWLRRRFAASAAAVALLFGSGVGTAFAADGAAPGDLLYGVDRAFEAIGIGDGGVDERFAEVEALIDRGDLAGGLEHAPAVVGEDDSAGPADAARDALRAAAERVRALAAVDPQSGDGLEGAVGDLLSYLSEHTGEVDGRRVAELASQIGETARSGRGPGLPGPPGGEPPGAPEGVGTG